MPRAKIKSLEEVDPIISKAFKEAFSNPGKEILVAPHLAEDVAINLQVKMKAVRQGFRIYFHEDHEYHRAAKYERIWTERKPSKTHPGTRDLVIRYKGMIKRPSEEYAEMLEQLKKNYPSSGE